MNIKQLIKEPIFFERNRVYRVYLGGKPYKEIFDTDEEGDNFFPEEWVASKVKAINPKYFSKRDGVSIVKGTNIYFDDLLNDYKEDLLGNRKYDCLVKFLDSAIRLPVQVHPTKEFSKKNFNSEYGKTESWLVIKTRPGAKMYFGFNKKYTQEYLESLEEKSETNKDIMVSVCSSVDVKVGDVFIIRAGLIHAIGAGCTVIEVQEPTDFTIQPEHWCGDTHISYDEEFIGLDKSTAMSCFDYNLYGDIAYKKSHIEPKIEILKDGFLKENLITYNDTTCFAENRYTINNSEVSLMYGPSIWIILSGKGEIVGDNYNKSIKQGDYFYLPYIAENKFKIKSDNEMILIECLPSKQE